MDRGVSPLIGMIFILMIVMIMLSIIQAYEVPKWSEEAEMQHYNKLVSEVSELSSGLIGGKAESIKLDAGLTYPKYPFLLTPPPASTTIYSKNMSVKIEYSAILPNGTQKTFSIINETSVIYFRPNYYFINVDSNLGTIVFENGVIFREGSSFVIPVTHQFLFVANRITFPIIKTNIKSLSTTSELNLKLVPLKNGYTVVSWVRITFETRFGDYWNETLNEWSASLKSKGYKVDYSVTKLGNLYSIGISVYGTTDKTLILSVPVWYVGVGGLSGWQVTKKILVTNPTSLTISLGSVSRVDVWVFDSLGRPIPGVKVNYSIDGSGINLTSASPVTDSNGEAHFYFRASTLGSGTIKFYVGSSTASVPFTVVNSGVQKQVVLNPIKDTYVSSSSPTKNFGKSTYLELGAGEYVLLQFNLSSIPRNSVIQGAKLKLYMYRNTATDYETITVHRILQNWFEYNVTWNNKPSYSQQIISYRIIPTVENTWIEFDVTSAVQKIVDGASNYGWLLSSPNPSGFQDFYSKEKNDSICPKLVVEYTPSTITATTTTTTVPTTTTTTTPTPTPTPTPPLHTSTLDVEAYRVFLFLAIPIKIKVTYTGDFSGSQYTPFTLRNSVYGNSSFTVTLTAPKTYGTFYVFDQWSIGGKRYYSTTVTVTVPDNSKLTAIAYYTFTI